MNPRRTLNATFWAAVIVQTLGSVDVGPNAPEPKRKLPAPKQYVAIAIVWAILGWVGQISDNLARAAAALGGAMLVTTLFVNVAQPGRFTVAGNRLIRFFDTISRNFGTQPVPPTTGATLPPQGGTLV